MKKKILVHICCAPCFVAPFKHLVSEGEYEVWGFWHNPNIHPYTEYQKRRDCVKEFTDEKQIPVIWKDEYKLEEFLRNSAFRESTRCQLCYYERLKYTAIIARKGKFDAFTSTLFYSKMQNHEQMKSIAESLASEYGIPFLYQDFRTFWKEGIELSKQAGMYRQQYCGCIYSEKDRFWNIKSQIK